MPRPKKEQTIDQRVEAYRASIEAAQSRRPPTEAEKQERLSDRLEATELALGKSDHRRIALLLRAAKLSLDREDYAAVHGYCAEMVTICRARVLGVREAFPILSTLPPQGRLPVSLMPLPGVPDSAEEQR